MFRDLHHDAEHVLWQCTTGSASAGGVFILTSRGLVYRHVVGGEASYCA